MTHLRGMEITYMPGCRMSISQHCYILAKFTIANYNAVPTPQVKSNFLMTGNTNVYVQCV